MGGVITYCRSSSMGTYDICAHRGMLDYMLSIKPPDDAYEQYGDLNYMRAMKAASKGSSVHKNLETVARRKKCQQEGIDRFHDNELDRTFYVNKFDIKEVIELSINHYQKDSQTPWTNWDKINVKNWTWKVLKSDWNPAKLKIIDVEKFFDIEIEEEWARYYYKIGDVELSDRYRLRGTMDLTVDLGNDTYSIRDWKTGSAASYDKPGNPKKTYQDLSESKQFLLYYYVAKKLYPGKKIVVEVNYIKGDGVSTLFMDDSSYQKAYDNIVNFFESVRNNYPPKLIKYTRDEPCGFCPHSQLKQFHPTLTNCEFFEKEAKKYSAEELINRYGSVDAMSKYSGGGAERDLSKPVETAKQNP